MTPLTTERLTLREFEERDQASLLDVLSDPEVMEFSVNGAMGATGVARFVETTPASYRMHGFVLWAVEERASARLIGFCGLSRLELDGRHEVELGYRLAPDRWGQGLATEAGIAVLDAAFSCWRLDSVIAIIARRHLASVNVARKLGMAFDHATQYHGWDVAIYRRAHAARPSVPNQPR